MIGLQRDINLLLTRPSRFIHSMQHLVLPLTATRGNKQYTFVNLANHADTVRLYTSISGYMLFRYTSALRASRSKQHASFGLDI